MSIANLRVSNLMNILDTGDSFCRYKSTVDTSHVSQYLEFVGFKLSKTFLYTLKTALKLIKTNCYMASEDLRHAYYSINMAESQQVKLCFIFSDKIYQFTCFQMDFLCPKIIYEATKTCFIHS